MSERRDGSAAYDITYTSGPLGNRVTLTYDDGGRLRTSVDGRNLVTTYSYDGVNRRTGIAYQGGELATFVYDATGLRRKRQDSGGTTDYLWDLENLLMELVSGSTEAQYTTSVGAYGPIVSSRRGATSRFLLTDALGSVTGLLDPSEAESDSYIYKAFGELAASSGSSVNPFRYVGSLGYYREADASLSYVRARWLRPSTGGWLSVDPVEGEARYLYVHGSPVMGTDAGGDQPPVIRGPYAPGGSGGGIGGLLRTVPRIPWYAFGPGGLIVYVGVQFAIRVLVPSFVELEEEADIDEQCNACNNALDPAVPPPRGEYVVPIPGDGSVRCRYNEARDKTELWVPGDGWHVCHWRDA